MTKQDAQFYGTLAGIIPALWVGAYLIHLVTIELARFQWWGLPWYATVLAIVALIPALFAWYFGWMAAMNDYMKNLAPHAIDGEPLTMAEQEAWIERWSICVETGHITEKAASDVADENVRNMRAKN